MFGSGLWGTQAPTRPHLLVGPGGLAEEVLDVRKDLAATLAPLLGVAIEEFDGPPPATATAILPVTASQTVAATYSYAALTGSVGDAEMYPARNIEVVVAGGTPANMPASVTITGFDAQGNALSETITGTSGGAGTYVTASCFAQVQSVSLPAGTGTGATFSVGTGAVIGLSFLPKLRCGQSVPLVRNEIVDGVLIGPPATGVITTPQAHPPYGSYTPATAPTSSSAAVVTGTANLNTAALYGGNGGAGTLNGLTLILTVNTVAKTLTLNAQTNAFSLAALLQAINVAWPGLAATVNSSGYLVLTDLKKGSVFTIVVGAGTANTLLGLSAGTTAGTGHSYSIEYEIDGNQLPNGSLSQ
jgi:hypothetical protein